MDINISGVLTQKNYDCVAQFLDSHVNFKDIQKNIDTIISTYKNQGYVAEILQILHRYEKYCPVIKLDVSDVKITNMDIMAGLYRYNKYVHVSNIISYPFDLVGILSPTTYDFGVGYKLKNKFELDLSDFDDRLQKTTDVWLKGFPWSDFKEICFSGGALLSCLSRELTPIHDIDLFVRSVKDTREFTYKLVKHFENQYGTIYYSFKGSVLTLHRDDVSPPLQIIFTSFESFYDITSRFDFKALEFWYSSEGLQFSVTALFELIHGVTTINKTTSPIRLIKYLNRGLTVLTDNMFVLSSNRFISNGKLDIEALIEDRHLKIHMLTHWYPKSKNTVNENINLLSKFLNVSLDKISTNIKGLIHKFEVVNNSWLTTYLGDTMIHLGDIQKINPKLIDYIDVYLTAMLSKKDDDITVAGINPIRFWICGKVHIKRIVLDRLTISVELESKDIFEKLDEHISKSSYVQNIRGGTIEPNYLTFERVN
jgi:hypothetical protein